MKAQAVNSEQKEAREELIGNFGSLYENIGQQDQMEQEQDLGSESDCDENEEMKDDEQIQPKKKSGGIFSGLFGSSPS